MQIEDKVFLESFLRWVRMSANFVEVPWLSFESKVSKLPGTSNNSVTSTLLTAENSSLYLYAFKESDIILTDLIRLLVKKTFLNIQKLALIKC